MNHIQYRESGPLASSVMPTYSDTCTCTLNRMTVTEDAKTFTLFAKHH
jgi:hypothetical protein